jgi:hypothetical protein
MKKSREAERATTKYVKGELGKRSFSKGGLETDHVIKLIAIRIVSDEKIRSR